MLLMRQKFASEGNIGITLQQKEIIDETSWDDLVKKNREKYKKYI